MFDCHGYFTWWWWFRVTATEWITSLSLRTCANWNMLYDSATSIDTTGSRAWVSTFLPYASLITRTIRIDGTFRTAVRRYSDVIVYACT